MANVAVIGAQWGDEGKGKIVDWLSERAEIVVRFQGGHNAGHTLVVGESVFKLSLLPSGVVRPGKVSVIGNGVVVDPEKLIQEMEGLEARGIKVGTNLVISDRAHVVMPYHKEQDAALEEYLSGVTAGERGNLSIGTTRRGIGPAYADKIHRSTAIRMGDLLDADYLASRLQVICRLRTEELKALGVQAPPLDPAALTARYAALGERLRPHVRDTVYHLHDCQRAGKSLLFEGANACLLDIDHGTYPYVTSSNCSTAGIHSGTGIPGRSLQRVIGIMKAYSTRVGAGPFPTELLDQTGSTIRERGREYGTTTGRPRRCGWLDLVAVRYSAMVCGATEIACTLFDVLTGFDELRICTHYRLADGTVTDRFIPDAKRLEGATPVYSTFKGWTEQVSDLPDRAALPQAARDYLDAVEQHVGVPVSMVSVGPERTQTLVSA